jgi:hypothetical protein
LERNSKPLRYYFKLKRILKEGSFDIVHVNGNSATNAVELLAAKRAGISVRIMHNHSVQCKYRLINIVFKPMLELGTVKTEYEKYKEKQTLTVSSEGVVPESLNTHYPNTSIINKNGTTMEIEYVVDTKNYIDEELSKLPIVKSVNGITPDENGNVSVDVGADVDSDSLPDYWNTYLTEKKSAILQERLNVGNHGDYFS